MHLLRRIFFYLFIYLFTPNLVFSVTKSDQRNNCAGSEFQSWNSNLELDFEGLVAIAPASDTANAGPVVSHLVANADNVVEGRV